MQSKGNLHIHFSKAARDKVILNAESREKQWHECHGNIWKQQPEKKCYITKLTLKLKFYTVMGIKVPAEMIEALQDFFFFIKLFLSTLAETNVRTATVAAAKPPYTNRPLNQQLKNIG